MSENVKNEISRRTRDVSKKIELEAQKVAVGEMVLERLDEILSLLRTAGFKVQRTVPTVPRAASVQGQIPISPNTVIVQDIAPVPAPVKVKNPCSVCGQEAAFDENMPDGSKKYYCRPHAQQRAREKAEEAQTASLMGNTGTTFARAQNPNAPTPQKTIIQTAADPLKGPFPNGGGAPPPNN